MTEVGQPVGIGDGWRIWWEYERRRSSGGTPIARINQLNRRRAVLWELIARGLKVKYSQSFLGYAWSLVEPTLLILVYWMVFGHVARLNLPNYPLFLASAMMPWQFFNGSLSSSTSAITSNSGIVRTINMPREIFPLAIVGEQTIEYFLSLPVVFVVGALYGVRPSHWLLWLPFAAAIEIVYIAGWCLLLSSMNTILRDVQRILRVALRVLFYLSPVLYPASRVHGGLGVLYKINPMVGILELNRAVWYPNQVAASVLYRHVAISIFGAALIFFVGWTVFIALERSMLKEL